MQSLFVLLEFTVRTVIFFAAAIGGNYIINGAFEIFLPAWMGLNMATALAWLLVCIKAIYKPYLSGK